MRSLKYISPLAILIVGCGLFKNTKSNSERYEEQITNQLEQQVSGNVDYLSSSSVIGLRLDSNRSDYFVELWPKGPFTFSSEKGFSGEAEKVRMHGSSKSGSSNTNIAKSSESQAAAFKSKVKQKQKLESGIRSDNKKSTPSWLWLIIGLVLLAVIARLALRKLKEKFTLKT